MANRRADPRRIKIHRSYTVEEAAHALKVCKGTVRNWVKKGLEAIDDRKPMLFLGLTLRRFLEEQRKKAKRTCPPGHLYCVRCRAPKAPALGMADYVPHTETAGNLQGICPDCETVINRRVSRSKIQEVRGDLEIVFTQAQPRIRESAYPTVNCD